MGNQIKKHSDIIFLTWIYYPRCAGVRSNEVADCLSGKAAANDSLSMEKKDIIKAIMSKLQGQEDTAFEGSTYHHLLERGVIKGGRQLKLSGRETWPCIISVSSASSANTHLNNAEV